MSHQSCNISTTSQHTKNQRNIKWIKINLIWHSNNESPTIIKQLFPTSKYSKYTQKVSYDSRLYRIRQLNLNSVKHNWENISWKKSFSCTNPSTNQPINHVRCGRWLPGSAGFLPIKMKFFLPSVATWLHRRSSDWWGFICIIVGSVSCALRWLLLWFGAIWK